jgi:hypothetical protein
VLCLHNQVGAAARKYTAAKYTVPSEDHDNGSNRRHITFIVSHILHNAVHYFFRSPHVTFTSWHKLYQTVDYQLSVNRRTGTGVAQPALPQWCVATAAQESATMKDKKAYIIMRLYGISDLCKGVRWP